MPVRARPAAGKGRPFPPSESSSPTLNPSNTVWRLTTDGALHGASHSLQDQSGRETYQWAPDGQRICYTKTGHRGKPNGFYVMDVESGEETFIARDLAPVPARSAGAATSYSCSTISARVARSMPMTSRRTSAAWLHGFRAPPFGSSR